jgi:GTPase
LQDYLDSVRRDRDDAEERAADPRYQGQSEEHSSDRTPD